MRAWSAVARGHLPILLQLQLFKVVLDAGPLQLTDSEHEVRLHSTGSGARRGARQHASTRGQGSHICVFDLAFVADDTRPGLGELLSDGFVLQHKERKGGSEHRAGSLPPVPRHLEPESADKPLCYSIHGDWVANTLS